VATDLIFQGIYTPLLGNAVELNFNPPPAGYSEASCSLTTDQVSIDGRCACTIPVSAVFTLNDVSIIGHAAIVHKAYAAFTLDDAIPEGAALFEAGVYRGLETSTTAVDAAGLNCYLQTISQFLNGNHCYQALTSLLEPSDLRYTEVNAGWAIVAHKHKPSSIAWDIAELLARQQQTFYQASPPRHITGFVSWDEAKARQLVTLSGYKAPPRKHKAWFFKFDEGNQKTQGWRSFYKLGTKIRRQENVVWDQGTTHSWLWGGWHYPPPTPLPVYVGSPNLKFYQPEPYFLGGAILVFGRPCYAWPLLYLYPILNPGVTILIHSIHVIRTVDQVNIPVTSVSLKFDSESWAWGVSLTLQTPENMALLESVNGNPCEIQVELDGLYFTALIEEWGENWQFGEHTYTASGRSPLALFSYPYAPVRSYLETDQKLAAQLIDFELSNTGWAAEYDQSLAQLFTTDWLIPGGAWSYQNKAPIDAIIQIAKAVGARAYADRNAKLIHIAPRYPGDPWYWDDLTPDQTIPLNLINSVSTQLTPQPYYNHVIVSGQSHGVTVTATISGSAGNVSAPMVTDNLITYVNAARERARNILSNTGKQARVTINLPLNTVTGLLEPGQLVKVSETTPWRGLVTGVNITANLGVITQSVEIERHYS
jgi:hypothetical protein